jgi:hypothetical protein
VFVREELELAMPVAVAREWILTQLRADGLHTASSAALDLGRSILESNGSGTHDEQTHGDRHIRGDGAVTRPSPHLSVHTLPAYTRGPVTVVPIRWCINGVGDGQPLLDANLEIGPAENTDTALLLLVGLFRPMGSSTDHGPHQQAVRGTPRNLLTTVAALLALNPTSNGVEHSV